jgi:hypothetical protein
VTAVGVCGFGRCGSSMVMRMLDVGGVPPVAGSAARSYELPSPESTTALGPAELEGRAVKLLDMVLYPELAFPQADRWKFVWMSRDHTQQARSQVKLLRTLGDLPSMTSPSHAVRGFAASYARDQQRAIELLALRGPVWVDTYEAAIREPLAFADRLARFLSPTFDLDAESAAQVVHDRRPYCAPDLAFEFGHLDHEGETRAL